MTEVVAESLSDSKSKNGYGYQYGSMHVPGSVCRDLCLNRITSTGESGLSTTTTLGASNMHAVMARCQPGDDTLRVMTMEFHACIAPAIVAEVSMSSNLITCITNYYYCYYYYFNY